MTRTETLRRGLSIKGSVPSGQSFTLTRNLTSLHGAAIRVRMKRAKWEKEGWVNIRVLINGEPVSEEDKQLVEPELREYL